MSHIRPGSRAVPSPAQTGKAATTGIGTSWSSEDHQNESRVDQNAGSFASNVLDESSISFQSMVESAVTRWIVDEMILDELIYLHWSYKAGLVNSEHRNTIESPAAARNATIKCITPNTLLGTSSEAKVQLRASETGACTSKSASQGGNLSSGSVNTNSQPAPLRSEAAPVLSPNKPLSSQPTSSATTVCPACGELVGSQRFAYHLFKCMGGGRKAAKPRRAAAAGFASIKSNPEDVNKSGGQQSLNNSNISGIESNKNSGTKRSAAMMRDLEFFQDKPIILKLKLNEKGLPLSKQSREIVSYDEFLSVVNSQN